MYGQTAGELQAGKGQCSNRGLRGRKRCRTYCCRPCTDRSVSAVSLWVVNLYTSRKLRFWAFWWYIVCYVWTDSWWAAGWQRSVFQPWAERGKQCEAKERQWRMASLHSPPSHVRTGPRRARLRRAMRQWRLAAQCAPTRSYRYVPVLLVVLVRKYM